MNWAEAVTASSKKLAGYLQGKPMAIVPLLRLELDTFKIQEKHVTSSAEWISKP
jgi:hypothetical protein